MGVPLPILCPLCLHTSHEGKCEKQSRKTLWCAHCLGTKLTKKERTRQVGAELLSTAGIHRASKLCRLCGLPACEEHGRATNKSKAPGINWVCGVCEAGRGDDVAPTLEPLLDIYEPSWRSFGNRCVVCLRPVLGKGLCRRHLGQLESGRTTLTVDKLMERRKKPSRRIHATLDLDVFQRVLKLVEIEGQTLSRYVEDLVKADLNRRYSELKKGA